MAHQKAAVMRSPRHALSAVIVADVDAGAMIVAAETMAVIVDKTNAKAAAVIVAIGQTAMNPVVNPAANSAKHASRANNGKMQDAAVTSGVKIVMVNQMAGPSLQTSSAKRADVIVAASPRASVRQAAQARRHLQPPQLLQHPRVHRRPKVVIKSARAVAVAAADAVDVKAEKKTSSQLNLRLPKLRRQWPHRPPKSQHRQCRFSPLTKRLESLHR